MIAENSLDGYILKVHLEYPYKLPKLHNDYPLATEKFEINHDILSKYCSNTGNKYDINIGNVNKLVPNLGKEKSRYVLHYRNLQLYLS